MSVDKLLSQISEGVDATETLQSLLFNKISVKLEEMQTSVMQEAFPLSKNDKEDESEDDKDDKDESEDDKDDSDDKEDADDEDKDDSKTDVSKDVGDKDKAEVKESCGLPKKGQGDKPMPTAKGAKMMGDIIKAHIAKQKAAVKPKE